MHRRPNEITTAGDTAIISLSQGQSTIIDASDLPLVRGIRWWAAWAPNVNGYYAAGKPRSNDGTRRLTHLQRFLTGEPPGMQIDHINRNTLDNRRSNLRVVTRSQNKANANQYRNNTSGFVGVYFQSRSGKWQASIPVGGHNRYLGTFKTSTEAAVARDAAAREVFGEHARLNFPDS